MTGLTIGSIPVACFPLLEFLDARRPSQRHGVAEKEIPDELRLDNVVVWCEAEGIIYIEKLGPSLKGPARSIYQLTRHGIAMLAGHRMGTIYHPANEAASETAKLVARLVGAKTKPLQELAEADLGLLDGLTEQAFAERFPKRYKQWQEDPLSVSLPEGEVVGEARARLFGALGRLLKRSRGTEVGVVLQSLGLGFLRCWLADRPPTELWTLVKCRPRVERYLLATETISQLAEAAKVQYSHS